MWPTAYYDEKSGVGLMFHELSGGNRRIGLVGLGAGTLATYAKPGDSLRIYEINPEVVRMAKSWFTFLSNCPAKKDIILGDARLSLEREQPQAFDLLVLDAFNSDAIPVHLLTKEAFTIYDRHIQSNGVIAVHISNKGLNLEPIVVRLARELGYRFAIVDSVGRTGGPLTIGSKWIILCHNEAILDLPAIRDASRPPQTLVSNPSLWTDEFTSLFQILGSEPAPQEDSEFANAESSAAHDLYQQGDYSGTVERLRTALKKMPRSPVLLNNLAFLEATCPDLSVRNFSEAAQLSEKACELTHYQLPGYVGTLAAIYSEAGRFSDAARMAEKTCALAREAGDQDGLKQSEQLVEHYRKARPFHEFKSGNSQ
jgi:tetratricopeptide (TPR) repeat protein